MFLLIFRYVFGGAIDTGRVAYVDFLIPAMAVTTGLFAERRGRAWPTTSRAACSTGCGRSRSHGPPRLLGRSLADTVLVAWGTLITIALGFATGFRFHGSAVDAIAAIGLCVLCGAAFTWPFIYMGLVSGSSQAAQGMSFMAFPFVFVSSAYVPVDSMPGWLQPVAEHQPITAMVGAVRSLALGDDADRPPRPQHHVVRRPGAGLGGRDPRRVRAAGQPPVRPLVSVGALPTMTWPAVCGRRLARHGLAAPVPRDRLVEQVGIMCGAHAQVMAAAELSIGLRVTGTTRQDVRRALWEDRTLVKTCGPRGTIHLFPATDLPQWCGALASAPAPNKQAAGCAAERRPDRRGGRGHRRLRWSMPSSPSRSSASG